MDGIEQQNLPIYLSMAGAACQTHGEEDFRIVVYSFLGEEVIGSENSKYP